MHNKFDSLRFDDEDKENVPPPTSFGGFSSRRKPGPSMPKSSSATKKDSFGAIVTGQNLAGPPLKLRVNINNLNRVSKKVFVLSRVAEADWPIL